VKYGGYRLLLERDGDRIRLITRGGYNWTDRYPWIVEAARKIRQKQFVLNGEAVILGVDGVSDFDALYSGQQNDEVQLCEIGEYRIEHGRCQKADAPQSANLKSADEQKRSPTSRQGAKEKLPCFATLG
jgi:hypothetical protein